MSEALITQTVAYVKHTLQHAEGGHDWWHVYRVWQLSKTIATQEPVNVLVVELAALLHDIADAKFNGGDETKGPRLAAAFLQNLGVDEEVVTHVVNIITYMSFKNSFEEIPFQSLEMQVVQDSDRLDAMGAIGIARTFNYGGFKNRSLYNPAIKPMDYTTKEDYKNSEAPTINHFYEKLLLLKDTIKTNTGKQLAEGRHAFMEQFLTQFFAEWEGEM
jgi:uncharacterized protein